MVLGHEILHPRGQKQRLIDLPGAECLAHAARENLTRASLASKIRYYSDRLLVGSIDAGRQHANLSSAIRLYVLDFYRDHQRGAVLDTSIAQSHSFNGFAPS